MQLINLSDTIAAISTPLGAGGIGIIRMSGKDSLEIAQKFFVGKKKEPLGRKQSHTISFGRVVDPHTKDIIDEVLISVMRAPNTYTKEDIIEINAHGGQIVVQKILSLCLQNGARLAEPGEFTKRAFLNGRIDLTQAESVMDIISAKTDLSRQAAMNQLGGSLRRKIEAIREKILDMTASLEAAIDYPEHDIEEETYADLYRKIETLLCEMQKLYDTADTGRILIQGINTVILGKPNVGKSSLLNSFLQEDRAIVTEIAGTTRDTLEEDMNLCGIPVKIIDTAGIRNTDDPIERLGVEKSREYALRADLILMMADYSKPFEKEDEEILPLLHGKKSIVLINKTDLPKKLEIGAFSNFVPTENIIEISLKENQGVERVTEKIKEMFFQGDIAVTGDALLQNARQKDALFRAICAIRQAQKAMEMQLPEDFISIDLQDALSALAELTGDAVDDEIIDRVFTKFCLGK